MRPAVGTGRAGPLLAAGSRVDHFQVMRLLGQGGMGEVYLARDTTLGRRVALKLLRAPAARELLLEAQATARVSHPNIVSVYSTGEHEGQPYLALEYLEGQTLRARLLVERPAIKEGIRIAAAVADALAEAHRHGVLHRDLKPENILLASDGRPRVFDFGLALADAGVSVGTPAYMAPEQWQAQPLTPATDVWALGLVLHELVSGRHPLGDGLAAELRALVTSPAPLPRLVLRADVPAALGDLIARCLDKEAARRPAASELAGVLAGLLGRDRAPAGGDESPFRGLLAFSERHARYFFGRDAEVAALVERLRGEALLPVVGPSGVGKSSFVQAGIIPRLREQGAWTVLALRPGSEPFTSLARALRRGEHGTGRSSLPTRASPSEETEPVPETLAGREVDEVGRLAGELAAAPGRLALALRELAAAGQSKVLLFIDQMEELYTLVEDAAVRERFVEAIFDAADDAGDPVRLVFTVRDDFLGRLAESVPARAALRSVTVLFAPSARDLGDILTRPLVEVGYAYDDPALVTEMAQAVAGEQAGLPLLQFALRALWDRRDRDRRVLRRADHEAIGGVAGALAEHAEGVVAGLLPDELLLARAVLVRLVTPEGTRRTLPRSRVLEGLDAAAGDVLARLVESRLVSVRRARGEPQTEPEIELAHESLVKSWRRVARWIEEGREELAMLAELEQAAELWAKRGRRADEVWQDEALLDAERTLARLSVPLPASVAEFLEAGRARARRRRRRRRVLASVGVAGLVLASVASLLVALSFGRQKQQAQRQRDLAEQRRAEAQAQRAEAEREQAQAALLHGEHLEPGALALVAGDPGHPARPLALGAAGERAHPVAQAARHPDDRRGLRARRPRIAVTDGAGGVFLFDAASAEKTDRRLLRRARQPGGGLLGLGAPGLGQPRRPAVRARPRRPGAALLGGAPGRDLGHRLLPRRRHDGQRGAQRRGAPVGPGVGPSAPAARFRAGADLRAGHQSRRPAAW
jgi:hypothetical protein